MTKYKQMVQIFRFHDLEALQKAEDRVSNPSWQLDCAGPWLARDAIVTLLAKGLGQRVSHLAVQLEPVPVWSLNTTPPNAREEPLTLGLALDPEHAFSLLEKGPLANLPEVI